IISGHKDNDSGAVCADGTTEAATNLRISEQVIALLQAQGIEAELLSENDPRLTPNYPAVAVISIHADSCQDAGATLSGYKTAVSQAVTSPLLQQCIEPIYGEQTGLKYNVNTITNDMTNYHAFSADQLSTVVPAIIIETGFLGGDKALLVDHSEIPAQAITDGILCFVEQLP
ncbi:MAG TPA: N-acetylmuramoyl-L-alanine amidase, partial [Anaerolineae bacterium]|nr:N-acetylmuramoyl-L-alanine amidase [Anaerolineae bacterium]